jgi:hypothetical protein
MHCGSFDALYVLILFLLALLTNVLSDMSSHTVMYIWACLCTELYSDYYKMGITDEDYFGRLDRTVFSKLCSDYWF